MYTAPQPFLSRVHVAVMFLKDGTPMAEINFEVNILSNYVGTTHTICYNQACVRVSNRMEWEENKWQREKERYGQTYMERERDRKKLRFCWIFFAGSIHLWFSDFRLCNHSWRSYKSWNTTADQTVHIHWKHENDCWGIWLRFAGQQQLLHYHQCWRWTLSRQCVYSSKLQ